MSQTKGAGSGGPGRRICPRLARICIAFTNCLFLVPTLALIGVAVALNYFRKVEILDFYQLNTVSDLNDAINATGLGEENYFSNADLITILSSVLLILMVCGGIIMVIIFVGCCGSCCKNEKFLCFYIFLLILCLIVQSLSTVLIYVSGTVGVIDKNIKDNFKTTLEKYEGLTGRNLQTFGWNFVMRRYSCCGLDGEDDFELADSWTSAVIAGGVNYTLQRPIVCCVTLPTSPNLTCATSYEETYNSKGCYDAVMETSLKNPYSGILPLVMGIFIQVSLVVCSCYLKLNQDEIHRVGHQDHAARHEEQSPEVVVPTLPLRKF